MKKLSNLTRLMLSLLMISAITSCTKDSTSSDNTNASVDGITISNVVPAYNSVTFDVVATDAIAIAYIAVESGTSLTAQEVFDSGEAKGSTEGTFTYQGDGLDAETDYILYVAAKKSTGNVGPASYAFTTSINTGAPTSDEAAGIRVVSVDQTSLSWEVTNGAAIDFSITMIQPTILMENDCYEAAKTGLSEEDYITNILISSDYSYLVGVTYDPSTSVTYNYGDIYTDYPLYPDANYTIYTVGCTGDYESFDITPLVFTKLEVKTEAFERIGNPYVEVSLKAAYYTSIEHYITPNDDAKYWTKLFTQTSEINEYIAYFDDLYGDGAGKARLREYIQQVDPYVLDQYGEDYLTLTLDWGYEGIEFSRFALGFDENLMPGDEYGESTDTVLEVDQDTADGSYTVELVDIGATNFTFKATLDPNCWRVYWAFVTPGSYTEDDLTSALAQDLDYQGYCAYRLADDFTEVLVDVDSNDLDALAAFVASNDTSVYEWFTYGQNEDSTFQLVSTSMNYYGKLSTPVLSEIYTTKKVTTGDYEQALTVKAAENGVAKTSILINYDVDKDLYAVNDDRVFYHLFLDSSDEFFDTYNTDEKIRDYLIDGENGNLFPVLSQDYTDADPYSWYFTWSSMDSDTEYKYIYCSENGEGVISNLKTTILITANNDGGDDPQITINIDADDYTYSASDNTIMINNASVVPNNDVVQFESFFIDEATVLNSLSASEIEDPEMLSVLFYLYLADGYGMPSNDTYYCGGTSMGSTGRIWLIAQGYGANYVQSDICYVCYYVDADGKLVVEDQVNCDYDTVVAFGESAGLLAPKKDVIIIPSTVRTSPFSAINRISNNYDSSRAALDNSFNPGVMTKSTRRITEEEAAELRAKGIPFYTMSELTRMAIFKEGLKK